MKKILLLSGLLALGSISALAQNRPPTVPTVPHPGIPGLVTQGSDLKRFDLDFPGGTVSEFVAAIGKATGRHLNMIVPADQAQTKIMPIKVVGVNVSELFQAIQMASSRQMPMVTGSVNSGSGRSSQVTYREVGLAFAPNSSPITDDTVWSFKSSAPTPEETAVFVRMAEPERVCQYFQLAPYLEDHSIEDITTAIQTGWKMLGVELGVEPVPQLSFHQETKLLIAVGEAEHVGQIPQVLQALPLDRTGPAEKIEKLQAELAALEEKKEPGWEKAKEETKQRIWRVVARQRAYETLNNAAPPPAQPIRVVPPR